MSNEKMAFNFAVNSQGFTGTFSEFQNLSASEKAEFEVGAGAENAESKIEFFSLENGMAVWAGEGRVLGNKDIVDCPLDFGTDDWENIYDEISDLISSGETEGTFSNEYEVKYCWELN